MEQAMASDKKKKIADEVVYDLPEGQYRLIGWDIDTTGKQLSDEICQIAAFYADSKYSQYILPQKDLHMFVERRYKIRIETVSCYRMLKDLKTNKFIKTKSEIAALCSFISWLEKNKGDNGIILVYHEAKKVVPLIFLETLKRYDLFDRFTAVVKGFCNTYTVARAKCAKTLKSFSLKILSGVLLDEEDDLSRSAAIRAKAYYKIIERIIEEDMDIHNFASNSKPKSVDVAAETQKYYSEFARQFSRSIDSEEKDLQNMKDFLDRLNSLRPVFNNIMSFDWVSKIKARRIRNKLAASNIHFDQLQNAWDIGGKKSIIQILKTVPTTRKKDYSDLLKILDCYFDPEKNPVNSNFYKRRKTNKQTIRNVDQENPDNVGNFSEVSDANSLQSEESL